MGNRRLYRDIDDYFCSHYWLSDKGIRAAIADGTLGGVLEDDIQPGTIEVRSRDDVFIAGYSRGALGHLPIGWNGEVFGDLRSTLRRKSLQTEYSPRLQAFMITNPRDCCYTVSTDTRIGHLYIGGGDIVRDYPHGEVVCDDDGIKRLIKEGYLEVDNPVVRDGFLVLHADGMRASPDAAPCEVYDIGSKPSFLFSPYDRLQAQWNKQVQVALREQITTSPYVGLQVFYFHDMGVHRGGVIDAGFSGAMYVQPVVDDLLEIKPDMPLAYCRVVHYPDGVGVPYGARGTEQYQGQEVVTTNHK